MRLAPPVARLAAGFLGALPDAPDDTLAADSEVNTPFPSSSQQVVQWLRRFAFFAIGFKMVRVDHLAWTVTPPPHASAASSDNADVDMRSTFARPSLGRRSPSRRRPSPLLPISTQGKGVEGSKNKKKALVARRTLAHAAEPRRGGHPRALGGLRGIVEDLPDWCKRPDFEAGVWLNPGALEQLWPHLSAALSDKIGTVVGNILAKITPLGISLSFSEFTLGTEPLPVGG